MKTTLALVAAAALSTAGLSACTTSTMEKDPTAMRVGDIHFPTRKMDNLNDADLSTMRADLVQMDNCLYLTNVRGKISSRRYAVVWPSNATVERKQMRGGASKLEVVSRAAQFNDNTRSVVTVPSRVEVLAQLVDEPFNGNSARLKPSSVSGCRAAGTARVRTFREVGTATAPSMR